MAKTPVDPVTSLSLAPTTPEADDRKLVGKRRPRKRSHPYFNAAR